jgi:hypothetical protein
MPETEIDEFVCACTEKCCTCHLLPDRCGRPLSEEAIAERYLKERDLGLEDGVDVFGLCDDCWTAINKENAKSVSEAGM